MGIASALLRKGDYKGAMKYAKLSSSTRIYSKAFEGYRREFLRNNLAYILCGAAVIAVTAAIIRRRRKRKEENAE